MAKLETEKRIDPAAKGEPAAKAEALSIEQLKTSKGPAAVAVRGDLLTELANPESSIMSAVARSQHKITADASEGRPSSRAATGKVLSATEAAAAAELDPSDAAGGIAFSTEKALGAKADPVTESLEGAGGPLKE